MSNRENYLRMLILSLPFLDYKFFNQYNFTYARLEKTIMSSIEHYSHSHNLDMTKSVIQFYYHEDNYNCDEFIKILKNISLSMLTYHHNRLCVDMFDDHIFDNSDEYVGLFHNKVLDYIELNKFISDSLLIAFYNNYYGYDLEYCIRNHMIQPISVVNHQLNTYLLKGIAETHTHVVGSIPFERQWNWICYQILDDDENAYRILESIDENENVVFQKEMCGYTGSLKSLIMTSVFLRLILMLFLAYATYHKNKNICNFLQVFKEKIGDENREIFIRLLDYCVNKEEKKDINDMQIKEVFHAIKNIIYCEDQIDLNITFSQNVYIDFVKKFLSLDFIDHHRGKYKRYHFCSQYIEYILEYESIKYFSNHDDSNFKKMFLHYVRVKNFIHSFITHSSDIKGFLEFQYFFKRQGMIYEIPKNMFTNIFNTYIYDQVRFLEVRIGHVGIKTIPENDSDYIYHRKMNENVNDMLITYIKTLLNFIESYLNFLDSSDKTQGLSESNENIVQVGLILHFNKRYDDVNKCWDTYFQVRNDSLLRYKQYQEICFLNLIIFQMIREKIKYADEYLVGIDGASNELLTEPWVLAPIFRSVKNKYSHTLKNKAREYGINLNTSKELGITYHVGEVFHSVASGLRHVDEVIDYYGFQNGERIGHGTVLGISIDEYIHRHKIISLPAIELLDNLLWLHHLKSTCNLFNDISISFFEQSIWKITDFIYDTNSFIGRGREGIDIHRLYLAYKNQFKGLNIVENSSPFFRCSSNFTDDRCIFKSINNWNEDLLFYSRHCKCFLIRMTRVIQIDIDDEMIRSIYKEAQQYIIDKIAKRGIIVESNPLSNITIGEIESIKEHPIFKLNDSFNGDHNHVMVSINTDDPGVFGTTLKNQYGFVLQALLDSGVSMEKSLKWIDTARENGLNSTFINRKRKTKNEIVRELTEMKEELRKKYLDD